MLSLAALLIYISAPTPAAAQADVDPVVADIAQRIQAMPADSGEVRRVAVRGEGRTLVYQLETAANLPEAVGPDLYTAVIANALCAGPNGAFFFSGGRRLRVEIRRAGSASTSATVDHCSAQAGQGLTAAGLASMLQPIVGREMDGVTFTSIRAEGDTVILVMDGAIGWRGRTPAAVVERDFLGNMCNQGASPFFDGTRSIRIDMLEDGRDPIRGRLITSCTAR